MEKSLSPKTPKPDEIEPPTIDPELLIPFATIQSKLQTDALGQVLDQASNTSRWLTGALLLTNGGAVGAVLNAATHFPNPIEGSTFFIAGMFLAMLNGWLVQVSCMKAASNLGKSSQYWSLVSVGMLRDMQKERDFNRNARSLLLWSGWAALPGWLSAFAFFGGVVRLGITYTP